MLSLWSILIKTYVFDIDGTICTITDGDYETAKPLQARIDQINKLYDEGHEINFLTARGMGRSNNNAEFAYNKFYDLTKNHFSNPHPLGTKLISCVEEVFI